MINNPKEGDDLKEDHEDIVTTPGDLTHEHMKTRCLEIDLAEDDDEQDNVDNDEDGSESSEVP